MSDRLPSTGRRPSMGPTEIRELLSAYFSPDSPSLEQLRQRFTTTSKSGVARPLSLATVRKYLKAAGVELPRGKAAVKERLDGRVAPSTLDAMVSRIPTEVLIGDGQAKLLARLLERGDVSQKSLGEMFGVSRSRVRRFQADMSLSSVAEASESPEPVEVAPEASEPVAEAAPESNAEDSESEAPVAEAESESEVTGEV